MANQSPSFDNIYKSQQLRSPLLQSLMIFIVIALFGWFILSPKYAATTDQKSQLETLETQQATLEADREELNRLVNKLESSEDEVKLLDEAVPLSTRATEISLLLESYGRATGLLVSQLNVEGLDKVVSAGDKEAIENPFGGDRALLTVNTQIVLTGNIEQFRNFLQLLETSGRLVDVDNLEVTSTGEGINFRMRVKTYAYMTGVAEVVPIE